MAAFRVSWEKYGQIGNALPNWNEVFDDTLFSTKKRAEQFIRYVQEHQTLYGITRKFRIYKLVWAGI